MDMVPEEVVKEIDGVMEEVIAVKNQKNKPFCYILIWLF